jgi:hypothetical protein
MHVSKRLKTSASWLAEVNDKKTVRQSLRPSAARFALNASWGDE